VRSRHGAKPSKLCGPSGKRGQWRGKLTRYGRRCLRSP
jgi:hypothetical protein